MTTFLDTFFSFISYFTRDSFIVPFLLIGYIFFNKKIFKNTIILLLFNILFNVALKVTFKVPLAPEISKYWYAFPSGHAQTAFVLYGSLLYQFKNIYLRSICKFLLITIPCYLIYFGYHDVFDIIGAIFFSYILLLFYNTLIKKQKTMPAVVLFLSTIFYLYSMNILLSMQHVNKIIKNITMSYFLLNSFLLFSQYFKKAKTNLKNNILL